tara:strand:- start:7769 stop:8482 length:714 start_codon:yes stop_codon:yes gene_type:complete
MTSYRKFLLLRDKDHTCYLITSPQSTERWIGGTIKVRSTREEQRPTWHDESPLYEELSIPLVKTFPREDIIERGTEMDWGEDVVGRTDYENALDAFMNFTIQTAERYLPLHPHRSRQDTFDGDERVLCHRFPFARNPENENDVVLFLRGVIFDLGINFHPDHGFEDIVTFWETDTDSGTCPLFREDEIAFLNDKLEKCHSIQDVDIYNLCLQVHKDFEANPMQDCYGRYTGGYDGKR